MPEDKALRLTRDRLGHSLKMHSALREAVLDNPGVTEFDLERIIAQLGERLDEFKHLRLFHECRDAFVVWAVRQSQMTVQLRAILRGVRFDSHVVTMLFSRLPEFKGTDNEFPAWVVSTAERELAGVKALVDWIRGHRRVVRRGIRSVLRDCLDLGIGEIVFDELETEVWRGIAYNTAELFASKEPIRRQLWWKGHWAAMAWKERRIAEKQRLDAKLTVDIDTIVRGEQHAGVAVEEVIDTDAIHNPIIIRELPWTDSDLERELRHAGPFRANDTELPDELTVAAA